MSNAQQPPAEEEAPKKVNQPKNTRLTQQELPACKPVLEPIWVAFIFLAITVVLIPIGAVCLFYGLKAVEVSARYDDICFPSGISLANNTAREAYIWQNAADDTKLTCSVTIDIKKDMPGPVYVYYELTGFYQNHRRYVKSRSDMQLAAETKSLATSLCKPQETYGNTSDLINPCGLVAWSFFNDTYVLSRGSEALNVSDKGIAFKSDRKYRFANYTTSHFNPELNSLRGGFNFSEQSGGATPGENERFMIWMRVAALPRFRKLWGKIGTDLKKGDKVTVQVFNRYNTYKFDGHKSIVLGTTTWLGGRNPFLGIAYIVTGGLSFVLCIVYWALRIARPRKFADPSALSFNKPPAGSG